MEIGRNRKGGFVRIMKKYAFGVDIGGTTVKLGLFETGGRLLETWEIRTRTEQNGKYILNDIAGSIGEKLEEKQLTHFDIEGIGLGVPGPVGTDGTVWRCVNLGWGILNVEQVLSSLSGMKVKAGNDANVAALGEMWQGGGKGYQDIVMVTLGTGVGGGVVVGGKILAGSRGAAGEIGHLCMDETETECCGCGKKGCLEQYASATGVVTLARRYLMEHPEAESVLQGMENYTAKDIFDAAKSGDAVCRFLAGEVGRLLGKGLAEIACVVNPEAFVIGGGMASAGSFLIGQIQKHFKQYAFHASQDTVFKLAELSNNAGIYGGVKLVLK